MIKNVRKLGLAYYYHGALRLAVHAAFKRYIEPSLGAFASYDLTQDPKIILMKLIDKGSVLDVISDLEDEFLILNQEIGQKYEMMDLDYPRFPIDQFKLVRRVFGFFWCFSQFLCSFFVFRIHVLGWLGFGLIFPPRNCLCFLSFEFIWRALPGPPNPRVQGDPFFHIVV